MNSVENNLVAIIAMGRAERNLTKEIKESIKFARESDNRELWLSHLRREWKERNEIRKAMREWQL